VRKIDNTLARNIKTNNNTLKDRAIMEYIPIINKDVDIKVIKTRSTNNRHHYCRLY